MAGRPKIEIDWEDVRKLSLLQCTQNEIASFLGVSVDTLLRRKEFCELYKKGMEEGRMSLRRLQWKKAQDGNTTMLIWLGKQYLGQSDKQELTGKDGKSLVPDIKFEVIDKEAKEATEHLINGEVK
jgi:hypothetical protein